MKKLADWRSHLACSASAQWRRTSRSTSRCRAGCRRASAEPGDQAWADDIKKASGGTITATIFPSEQLGKAFDHYDMARDGIADFAYVNPGYQPGRFPIIAGGELPFLFANAKGGSAALDAWYRKYAAKEMKDVQFCFAFVHDPGTFHGRKKIVLPDRHQGHEDPAGAEHHRPDGDPARRHQRAGLGARGARHAGARRRRRDHLPVGLDRSCSASTRW